MSTKYCELTKITEFDGKLFVCKRAHMWRFIGNMDEGISYIFYVIVDAIRNILVYTPFKFMLCAIIIALVMYFFVLG